MSETPNAPPGVVASTEQPKKTHPPRHWGSAEPEAGKCGAKLQFSDPPRYCLRWPLRARTRCKKHGGRNQRGILHASFKTGRYSKYMPRRVAERVMAAREDPELLSLRSEMELAAARIGELLEAIGEGEAGQHTDGAYVASQRLMDATTARDWPGRDRALADLLRAVRGKGAATRAWREIGYWVEVYRRLQESEVGRLKALMQMVTVEELAVVVSRLVDIVAADVPERERMERITRKIEAEVLSARGARAVPAEIG